MGAAWEQHAMCESAVKQGDRLWGPPSFLCNGVPWFLYPGLKRKGRVADD
jgi:hypothetical protein